MVHFKNHTANEESIRVSEERSTSSGRRSHSTKDVADDTHQPSGRHTCAFWTIVWLIFALTVGNLILTLTIIGVLHLGRGMEYLELVPEAESIKFFGSTDLDRVSKPNGLIEGFADVPMSITGDKGNVEINFAKKNSNPQNKMLMSRNGTQFNGINHFEIRDAITEKVVFTTHKPTYKLHGSSNNLYTKMASTSYLTSPIDEALQINSTKGKLLIRSGEGIQLEAKEIILSADQNVQLKSINGNIFLSGNKGVYLDIKNIPIVEEHVGIKMENKQFKICVCMPQGKLFRVPISNVNHNTQRGACAHFSSSFNPCLNQ